MNDDMMGLEFGEYAGIMDSLNWEAFKDVLVAGSAGGGALLVTAYALREATERFDFMKRSDANMQKVQNGVIQLALGLLGGGLTYEAGNKGREVAAMGVIGGLGAVGVVNIINGLFFKEKPLSLSALPEDMELSAVDPSMLSNYGEGMEALAALEATNVSSAPGAFQGFADPTVTPEALMGLGATMVQQETLGAYNAYLS